jgi:hypothetical protein
MGGQPIFHLACDIVSEDSSHRGFVGVRQQSQCWVWAYLTHYHHERNHQGLTNRLIASEPRVECQSGLVVRRERLGGLLTYYYRETA